MRNCLNPICSSLSDVNLRMQVTSCKPQGLSWSVALLGHRTKAALKEVKPQWCQPWCAMEVPFKPAVASINKATESLGSILCTMKDCQRIIIRQFMKLVHFRSLN